MNFSGKNWWGKSGILLLSFIVFILPFGFFIYIFGCSSEKFFLSRARCAVEGIAYSFAGPFYFFANYGDSLDFLTLLGTLALIIYIPIFLVLFIFAYKLFSSISHPTKKRKVT